MLWNVALSSINQYLKNQSVKLDLLLELLLQLIDFLLTYCQADCFIKCRFASDKTFIHVLIAIPLVTL